MNQRNANHKAQAESTHAHDDAALAPTSTAPPHRGSGGIGSRAAGGIRNEAQRLGRRHVAAHGRRHGCLARHDGDLAVAVAVGHRGRVRDGRRTRGALGPARTPAHPAVEAAVVVPAAARACEPRGPVAHVPQSSGVAQVLAPPPHQMQQGYQPTPQPQYHGGQTAGQTGQQQTTEQQKELPQLPPAQSQSHSQGQQQQYHEQQRPSTPPPQYV
ncbi:hypothetical protein G7054_g8862 [Neopestalotiopsis clavispora]|nr:hypothetical protein G7054_g8862 [Neopestalotiopsis clavispora]